MRGLLLILALPLAFYASWRWYHWQTAFDQVIAATLFVSVSILIVGEYVTYHINRINDKL